jgi:hypothetical protein
MNESGESEVTNESGDGRSLGGWPLLRETKASNTISESIARIASDAIVGHVQQLNKAVHVTLLMECAASNGFWK